jgi:ADP-ribose pyrophosphatase
MHSKEEKSLQQALRERSAYVSREKLYEGRVITLCRDTYLNPEGQPRHWDVVVHPGAVVLIPITPEQKLLFVKQWRRPIDKITLELPAGTLEKHEQPLLCAQRELQEETGYRAQEIIPLGGFYSAPGFCSEYLHLFLALNLEEAPLVSDDEEEEIDLVSLSFDEVAEWIEEQKIEDVKSIAGFYRYAKWLKARNKTP